MSKGQKNKQPKSLSLVEATSSDGAAIAIPVAKEQYQEADYSELDKEFQHFTISTSGPLMLLAGNSTPINDNNQQDEPIAINNPPSNAVQVFNEMPDILSLSRK